MDPTGVVNLICDTATSLHNLAPVVALLWIAVILLIALAVRGTAQVVLIAVGVIIPAFAITIFNQLFTALTPGLMHICQ